MASCLPQEAPSSFYKPLWYALLFIISSIAFDYTPNVGNNSCITTEKAGNFFRPSPCALRGCPQLSVCISEVVY
jgi:hypothetical protein